MRKILNFLKRLFFREEEILVKSEIEEYENKEDNLINYWEKERKEDEIKLLEKRKGELQNKKETIEIKKINSQFQDLVDNIEPNRKSIIKFQENNLPKVKEFNDKVEYTFKGITFIFCKEGYRLFNEEFNDKYHHIIINKGYLSREHNGHDYPYCLDIKEFHRWFMRDEVKKLANELECSEKDIHVHHKNEKKWDNTLNNLEILHKDNHAKKHGFDIWLNFEEWKNEHPLK